MRDKGTSSGNIFFVLFAAIGLVGALAASIQTYIAGPLRTSTFINQKSSVEAQMDISVRVAMTNASIKQPLGGDCDADGTVEPIPYDAGGGASVPVGGGLLPVTIAGNVRDPWGNRYGYCAWDHGSAVDDAGCGGPSQSRLPGTNVSSWPMVAIISAGPNRVFETTCNDWVDANADLQPDTPLVQRAAVTDDMHKGWSYDEANAGGGGPDLWSIEGGDPNTIEIDKNISVKDGSNNEQLAFDATSKVLTIGAGGEAGFPTLRTNRIEELTGPADPNDLQTQSLDPLTFAPEDGSGISYTISNPTGDNLIVSDGTRSVLQFRADAAGPVSTDGFKIFDPPSAGTGGAEFTMDSMGLNLISSLNASPAMNVEMANVGNNAAAVPKPNRIMATPSNEPNQALYMNLETNGAAATNLAGNITFHARPLGLGTSGPGPEVMRITASGNVGIERTNPLGRLHVHEGVILGDGGNVGIGTSTLPEKLNINGALRLGSGGVGETCNFGRRGGIRYNSTSDCLEVCDGAAWACTLRDSCADITPEILTWGGTSYFEDQINATASTVTATRNTFQVNSVSNNCTLEVSVTGAGSPESRVCSDSACSTVVHAWSSTPRPVTSGQYVQLRATSPGTAGAQHKIMARIGTITLPWILGTQNNDCTIAGPELGTLCADGTVYIGRSPDGWTKMYATPCRQGQTLSGGVCTGVASSLRWSNNNTIATGRISTITGEANTTALAALANADAPYSAAQACDSLSFGGHTDWYLPATDETANFIGVCSKQNMSGCTTATRFWTSSELSASRARVWQSASDFLWDDPKTYTMGVWCVRKD